jgi:mono/diheme cytochrome c family protein
MSDRPSFVVRSTLLAAAALLVSCGDGEKSKRGIELMPDMFHTPAYKQQRAMVVKVDGVEHDWPASIPPVAGTVPRGGERYPLAPADLAGAKALVNPLEPTTAVLREGQYRFNIYCAVCHGRDGNPEHGYVAKHFGGIKPLNGAKIDGYSDGEIYHIVTCGVGRMPNYAAQLLPEQRWSVVSYVRVLNRAAIAASDEKKVIEDVELSLQAQASEMKTPILDQRRHDLDAVRRLGENAGEDFMPLPDARPEYATPTWPEADAHGAEGAGGEGAKEHK